jgi:DNA-binding beta-propeller fold protein YncE
MRCTLAILLTGCTGFSLGENMPGGDTPVDPDLPEPGQHRMGAIAVEPDEAQLWVVHEANEGGDIRAHLSAVDPVTGATSEVLDVSGTADRRVVFPSADRMILFAQTGDRDNLTLIDTSNRTAVTSVLAPTWYWGTRTAPSGNAVVVADNNDPNLALHVIDTKTLGHQVIVHDGDMVEGMWNHSEDVFIALSVTDPFGSHPVAKLLRYDWRGVDFSQPLPGPTVEWSLAGYGWDFWFSFTWIGISPDDHWAVFPLIKHTAGADNGEHVLLVLDQTTGGVSLVPGSGPVGFTRDSSRIVSYGVNAARNAEDLWLIDPASHATQVVTLPWQNLVSFFPMHDIDDIVVTPSWSGGPVAIYDQPTNAVRSVGNGDPMTLDDFVSRPGKGELWLESGGTVAALDVAHATLTTINLGAMTSTINVRPSADQAVVGDGSTARIFRVDMATHAVTKPIQLPSPFGSFGQGNAISSIAVRHAAQSTFDPAYKRELAEQPMLSRAAAAGW